jgi:hypothetical protein
MLVGSIMRLRSMAMPFALGLAGYAFLRRRRTQRAARDATRDDFAIDPLDAVQSFDKISELELATLDVDALSSEDIAAAEDLAALEAEPGSEPSEAEPENQPIPVGTSDDVIELEPSMRRDAGDLYGAHTPRAADRDHPDDDGAFDEGQNWLEALEASAIENGPEPERELDDIVDDEDVLDPPHASATRDRPIADHGSGGRRGL